MGKQVEQSEKLNVYIDRDSAGNIDHVTVVGKLGRVQYWYPMGERHIESIDVMMREECRRQLMPSNSNVNVKFIEEE